MLITEPSAWVEESYNFAKEIVYGKLNGKHVVTDEYREEAFKLIEKRLVLGGYRLCDILIRFLKD